MVKIYMYGVSEQERPIVKEWQALTNAEVYMDTDILEADTVERCKGYDGVSTYQYKKVDLSVYETLKSYGIRNIAQRMAGYDPYDLDLATQNGIIITNVPDYSPESIAEYTVAQALNGIRNLYQIHERVAKHNFSETLDMRGRRLGRLTVAIIGTGRIGRSVAQMFHYGFGSTILGYDVYQNEEAKAYLTYVDTIDEIVSKADIISLHLPAMDETFHIFNKEMLSKCKKNAVLVNAGRGVLIDTEALLDALDEGHLGFAALDTYEGEFDYVKHDYSNKKIKDETLVRLLNNDKVSYTPHIAYYTDESVENMVHRALQSTLEIIDHNDSKYRVN